MPRPRAANRFQPTSVEQLFGTMRRAYRIRMNQLHQAVDHTTVQTYNGNFLSCFQEHE